MSFGKIFTKKCAQLHVLFSVETILSFGWDLEKYRQKCVPSYTFCSLWRLTWVFDVTWKVSTKRCDQLHIFFRSTDYLKFSMVLRKVSTKRCDQLHGFNAVENNLSFWWDLESFDKKVWPVTHFLRSTDYLKFSMVLRKVSTKRCDQLHGFNAVETNLSFWWDLESFEKSCDQLHLFGSTDYLKFFMGLRKVSTKRCDQLHGFNAVETNLSFWMGLRKFPTNMCAQLQVFSQCRLSQVFDGTWKNFHKKVCPVTRFVRCGDYLKFWMGLRKVSTKKCAQSHVSSLWRLF